VNLSTIADEPNEAILWRFRKEQNGKNDSLSPIGLQTQDTETPKPEQREWPVLQSKVHPS
jgi:hypothetical protein